MGITFAVRGNSLDARYSLSGKSPSQFVTTSSVTVVTGAGTGIIGDAYINQANATNLGGLVYPGSLNLSQGQAWSVLIRANRRANVDCSLFSFRSPLDLSRESVRCHFSNGVGAIFFGASDKESNPIFSAASLGATMDLTTWVDYVITCTGTTAANGLKFYKDGVLISQNTLVRAFTAPISFMQKQIAIGYGGVEITRMWMNEFVLWDEVIDPTNVLLTSGTGSLNGVSRAAFVDVAAFDGQSNSAPSANNVKRSISYVVAGSSYVGTLGSSDPGIANVRLGTVYEIESVSRTGTLVVPAASNVKLGVSFDNTVGTLQSTNPGSSNVLSGVSYVIESSTFTGVYACPTNTDPGVGNVKSGTTYVYQGVSQTGTLLSTDPGSSNVLTGVGYFINSSSLTGVYAPVAPSTDPGADNVKSGITYIYQGTSSTGTLLSVDPGSDNVVQSVPYVINSVSLEGVYVIPPASTDPGEINVKDGVTYLYEGVTKTGSLTCVNPGASNVKKGVDYTIYNEDFEGTFTSGLNPNSGNFSPVPQVQGAMLNYFQNMVFTVVSKSVEGFQNTEVGTEINFRGVFQPAGPRVLEMKPEGQRIWKWFIVHSNIELPLQPDDVIEYGGTQYRVKSDKNYSLYGYYEYEIIEDWEGSGP